VKRFRKISIAFILAVLALLITATAVYAIPGDITKFTANPSNTSMILTWVRGTASTSTVIRYRTDTYPANPADGTSAYSGTAAQTNLTGLTAGTVYYFAAWGYDGANYSASVANLVMSTKAVGDLTGGDDFPVPTLPAPITQTPIATGASNFEPFYTMVNLFAADWEMPANNMWLGFILMGVVGAGIVTYIKIREILVAFGVMEFLLVIGVVFINVPGWILIIPLVLGLGVWAIERYYQ
jgi:hypothetical protein